MKRRRVRFQRGSPTPGQDLTPYGKPARKNKPKSGTKAKYPDRCKICGRLWVHRDDCPRRPYDPGRWAG